MAVDHKDFKCPSCSFELKDLDEGGKMFEDAEYAIFLCKDCGTVFSKNYFVQPVICTHCNSGNVVHWDKKCPHCNSTMTAIVRWSDEF